MKPAPLFGWATLALATATLTACAPSAIELPQPPMTDETAAIAAVYENPTGTVDTAHIDMVLADAQTRLEELHLDWLPDLLADALVALENRLSDSELSTDPNATPKDSDPRVNAVATLNRTCRGWTDPPGPPDPATNGTIDLTAVVGGSEVRRDLWGVATNCHTLVTIRDGTSRMGFIDGTFIVMLRGALPKQGGDLKVLFLLSGRLDTSASSTNGTLDFLIDNGQIQYRQPVDDGDVIVTVGLTTLTIRGSNGTFTCDADTTPAAGGVVGSRCQMTN